jgi:hypothetical protein
MAAGSTYTPIATTTLGSAAANVTFSSLGSYTDLVLIFNGRCTSAGGANAFLQFNGDTATNYSSTGMYGDGTSVASFRGSNNASCGGCIVDNVNYGTVIYNIMNYANSSSYKTVIGRGSNTGQYVDMRIGLWRSTAAITSILIYSNGGDWLAGSTFTLYGITAA